MILKINFHLKIFFICLLSILCTFKNYKKIKIAIYYFSLYNGGAQRITSLLINYLSKSKFFNVYLFLNHKVKKEYKIPNNIKRIYIKNGTNNLIKELKINKIDIIIYQFYNVKEITILNNLNSIKTIIIIHCSFLSWIYFDQFKYIKILYNAYKKSKYIVSLIPFENDFLFKQWGINSILLNNFITYEYDNINPSDLSSKIILMIGRANDKRKRFELGIKAMHYISEEIPESEMKIISDKNNIDHLIRLVKNLKIEKNVKFVGYSENPEKFFKNASLNIIPSSTEAFPLALCETKTYGIPNIIMGISYVLPAKGGVINIYDDEPKSVAKEAIKILKNEKYRKKLGKEARESMKQFKNDITAKSWIELIIAVYKGQKYYNKLKEKKRKISKYKAIMILKQQIKLLQKRNSNFKNITIDNIIQLI